MSVPEDWSGYGRPASIGIHYLNGDRCFLENMGDGTWLWGVYKEGDRAVSVDKWIHDATAGEAISRAIQLYEDFCDADPTD